MTPDIEEALMYAWQAGDIAGIRSLLEGEGRRAQILESLLHDVLRTTGPVEVEDSIIWAGHPKYRLCMDETTGSFVMQESSVA